MTLSIAHWLQGVLISLTVPCWKFPLAARPCLMWTWDGACFLSLCAVSHTCQVRSIDRCLDSRVGYELSCTDTAEHSWLHTCLTLNGAISGRGDVLGALSLSICVARSLDQLTSLSLPCHLNTALVSRITTLRLIQRTSTHQSL